MKPEATPEISREKRSARFLRVECGPMLISFSGVDGAGKSTQIESLCAAMRAAGLQFRVVRFWDEIARFVRFRQAASVNIFKSETGIGAPDAPVSRRDKNVRSRFMTCVRLCLYLADALSLRTLVKRELRSGYDAVLFDRFIYDELANLNLNNLVIRSYIRVILAIVPRPDISYLLDADPVQARARKPEYPLEFLYENRRSYLELSQLIDGITVINPMPVEEVGGEIMKHGAALFSGKDREYVA
jgi:thymidylate kinase